MRVSEALPTIAMTLSRSLYAKALQATVIEGLAQGFYVSARAGVQPRRPFGRKASTLPKRHHAPQCAHQYPTTPISLSTELSTERPGDDVKIHTRCFIYMHSSIHTLWRLI